MLTMRQVLPSLFYAKSITDYFKKGKLIFS